MVIIALPISDEEQRRLDLMDVAVIMAGGTLADHPHVRIDDVVAARQAVNHLIHAGHRRIGMINALGDWQLDYAAPGDRLRGFRSAMCDAGLPVIEELVVDVPWGAGGGALGMDRLLSVEQPPTAVFAFSDELAVGAIRSLRRAGLPVPGAVSVIGIDDHPIAELTDLTTVRQPVRDQGLAAGRLALAVLAGRPADIPYLRLPTQLVVRSTTGPPAERSSHAG